MRIRLLRSLGQCWVIAVVGLVLGSTLGPLPLVPERLAMVLQAWFQLAPANSAFYIGALLLVAPGLAAIGVAMRMEARERTSRQLSLRLRIWRGRDGG
jgi:uncharacterized membrane protein